MITVQLMGGLGNQMFQYALAKNLAVRNRTGVVMDLTFLKHRLPGSTHVIRNYDLDVFDLNGNFTTLSKAPASLRNPAFRLQSVQTKLLKLFGSKNLVAETKPYQFDAKVLKAQGNLYLTGYWQNEKYFKDIEDDIRYEFTSFRHHLSEKSRKLMQTIEGSESICVNFRRTDYVASAEARNFHGNASDTFYKRGVRVAAKRFKRPRLFVFSDDIEWCKKNFRYPAPTVFVDKSHIGPKYSDYFRLMMACKAFVIPNSTFAWWAAWLSPSKNKKVVAPKTWVADTKIDASDFVPKTWTRIENG